MRQIQRLAAICAACALLTGTATAQEGTGQAPHNDQIAARREAAAARERAARLAQQAQRGRQQTARKQEALERSRRARREAEMRTWPEVTEPFSQTVRLGRNGTLDLHNVSGTIVVTGGRSDEARIEAVKRARHPREEMARTLLREIGIALMERGGNVDIRTEHPRRRDGVAAVDYTVSLPSSANVTLRTASGDVTVTNVAGELRVESGSGNVATSNVRRVRQIRTVSGNVEVQNGEADEFSATTVGGDVTLRNIKGRLLDLNTVHGNVRLVDVDAARARLQSMAGDLDYSGALARNGKYEFQTHSGNITLTPLRNPGFDFEAVTLRGAVRSGFELKASITSRPTGTRRSLRGTVGDAGAMVTAQSFSGDIVLVRR